MPLRLLTRKDTMKTNGCKHKAGKRVSGLCSNGTVKETNSYRMCRVKWDFGGDEWLCDTFLKPERQDWNTERTS
jgi:hypothetical protein